MREVVENKKEILIVFLGSLLSFYFSFLGNLRLFDFVSFFILYLCFKKNSIGITQNSFIKSYFFFFTLFITFSFIISLVNKVINIHIPRIMGTYFTVIYSILFFSYFENKIKELVIALKYTIYIHVSFFYIQFLMFNLFGIYIDFLKAITGNESRNTGGQFSLDTAIRGSGLYSEPASYSLFILSFMSAYIYYKRRIDIIDFLVLLSVLLSMSASGLVYLLFFVVVFFFYYSKTKFISKVASLFFFLFSFFFLYFSSIVDIDYVWRKILNFDSSVSYQYRVGNTEKVLDNLSNFQLLFGIGYANQDILDNKGSTYSALFIEQGYVLGIIFLSSFFFLLRHFKTNIGVIFYVFILLLGTHVFAQIQFWIWIISILLISQYLKYERKNL